MQRHYEIVKSKVVLDNSFSHSSFLNLSLGFLIPYR